MLHNSLALLTFNDLHSAELLTQSEHLIQLAGFFYHSQEPPNNQMLKQMADIMVGWQVVGGI